MKEIEIKERKKLLNECGEETERRGKERKGEKEK